MELSRAFATPSLYNQKSPRKIVVEPETLFGLNDADRIDVQQNCSLHQRANF